MSEISITVGIPMETIVEMNGNLLDNVNSTLNIGDELIITVLLQRSYGLYIQSGALKSLSELVKTYPLLNEIAKKKSISVAKLLSDLC